MGRSGLPKALASLTVLLGLATWTTSSESMFLPVVGPHSTLQGSMDGSTGPTVTRTPTPTTTGGHYRSPTPTRTPPPSISDIAPESGPASGGTEAMVTGAYFLPGATTTLGGVPATDVVLDAAHIQLTAPPLAAATLNDLTVTNPGGQFRTWPNIWFADFLDVPQSSPFHGDIERIFRQGLSAGCGEGQFCPGVLVTRAQMAVFLAKGDHGEYVAPSCTSTVFADVPCPGGVNVDWINDIHSLGMTAGCGGGNYCPLQFVTRAQVAVFLLKRTHAPGYEPPACTATVFIDAPCPGGAYVDWINEFAAEGLTFGCGTGFFCPSAGTPREQMATFLVRAFGIP